MNQARLLIGGWVLIGLHAALLWINPLGAYEEPNSWLSAGLVASTGVLCGGVYLFSLLGNPVRMGRREWIWVILIGCLLRVLIAQSPPAFEDDFYRYLWDGGVTAQGINPYAWAPAEIGPEADPACPAALTALRRDAGSVFERINHPWLRTIYPPVSQLAFAVAHRISPWSLSAWRFVLAIADVATLFLLLLVLRELKAPAVAAALYWWNPVLVRETYNACHMDVLTLAWITLALWLALRRRHVGAIVALALAMGTKFWPIVLLPLFARPLLRTPRRLLSSVGVFAVVLGACLVPIMLAGLGSDSGFASYMKRWEMNDGFYMLLMWGVNAAAAPWGLSSDASHMVTRGLIALILALAVLAAVWRVPESGRSFCERALWIVALVFLLSPTQFPWYFLWMLPFLAAAPRLSLLLLTALMPLYYLRFAFEAADLIRVFDYGVVWVEYVPVYLLLLWEWRRRTTGRVSLICQQDR